MKKWYICKYGLNHIQAPHFCKPIGIAFQTQQGDSESASGFIDVAAFSKWLEKNDLCAFGPGYAESLGVTKSSALPVIYDVRKERSKYNASQIYIQGRRGFGQYHYSVTNDGPEKISS